MTDLLQLAVLAALAALIPTSACVFAVAQHDRLPTLCAIAMVAVLGLHYCSMKALP